MLVQQLRESCGYLSDAGWEETSKLMLRAADGIEQLAERGTGRFLDRTGT